MRFFFKEIVLEYRGGPLDGSCFSVFSKEIESMLTAVKGHRFKIGSIVRTKSGIEHLYLYDGPYQDLILESHITLNHFDTRRVEGRKA